MSLFSPRIVSLPVKSLGTPLVERFTLWLIRRRLSHQLEHIEGLPPHLLRDIGLPDCRELQGDARRVVLLAALRDGLR